MADLVAYCIAEWRRLKPGDVLTLKGLTQKGKNRIREHGDRWLVREIDRSALSPQKALVCPATYVGTDHLDPAYDRPGSIHQADGYARWVRGTRDEHFEIVEIRKHS